jgi:hypothetical protein
MNPGFNGALRGALELRPWFAIDSHLYLGYASARNDVAGHAGFLTVGGSIRARFALPLQYARPYLAIGPGVYSTSVTGSGPTSLYGATAPAIDGGLGIEVPLRGGWSIGAEYVFHYEIGEKYSNDASIEGGDPATVNTFVQVTF